MAKKSAGTTNLPVRWDEELARRAQLARGMESSVTLGNFLSTKGGILSYQGNAVPGNKFDCIVLTSALENSYYEGDFDPDTPASPVCFAFGVMREGSDPLVVEKDMKPHEKSESPQHDECNGCPQNEFGTAARGAGKACKNTRRLALLHADHLRDGAEGIERANTVFYKPPVTSVRAWAGYVMQLANVTKKPPFAVVTELAIVPDPKNQFRAQFTYKGAVTDETVLAALMKRADQVAMEIDFPYPPNQFREVKGKGGIKKRVQPRRAAAGNGKAKAPAPRRF